MCITIEQVTGLDRIFSLLDELDSLVPDSRYSDLRRYTYLVPVLDGKDLGLFVIENIQNGGSLVHWSVHKQYRGVLAYRATRKALDYIKEHFKGACLIGMTPACYPEAIRLCKKLGFQEIGTLKESIKINNTWHDQVITQLNCR